jgi:hypothetical protein
MKKLYSFLTVMCLLAVPYIVKAASFDGTAPLLCAFTKAMECSLATGCEEVTLDDINLRQFVNIDFTNKTVKGTGQDSRETPIEKIHHIAGKLIIHGAQEGVEAGRGGAGWTASIMEDTGKLVLTAASDQVGFVIFGACIPK